MSKVKIQRNGTNEMIVDRSTFDRLYHEKGFVIVAEIADVVVEVPMGAGKTGAGLHIAGTIAEKGITTTAKRTVKASTHARLTDAGDEVSAEQMAAALGLEAGETGAAGAKDLSVEGAKKPSSKKAPAKKKSDKAKTGGAASRHATNNPPAPKSTPAPAATPPVPPAMPIHVGVPDPGAASDESKA